MQTVDQDLVSSRAPSARSRAPTTRGTLLGRYGELALAGATALVMLLAIGMAFFYAPTEAVQGNVQRIEYIHVPIAWTAFLAFFIVFVASALYLWRKDERWDWLARSGAEIGTIFTTLALIT
ncbi:MAG TPA: cytochrome c biogenesis protein CcsA, partial [Ktedonobacterales bacterium]|nr:cytochrome c biogenesis protein CcsA [Ktedonobacterales bacterium]